MIAKLTTLGGSYYYSLMHLIHTLCKQLHSKCQMLYETRHTSRQRKMILSAVGLLNPQQNASSSSTKTRRLQQINECIDRLQAATSCNIQLLKSFTLQTIKREPDIYDTVYDKLAKKFKHDFQTNINDFNNDYMRQTNEAFLNVLNHFSERSHLNARKQMLMKKHIVIDDNGMCSFGKAQNTVINDVKLPSGNSRNTTKSILQRVYDDMNDISQWDITNLMLMHRQSVPSITLLLKTFFNCEMVGALSEYNRSNIFRHQCKNATETDATKLGIPVQSLYFLFPKTLWLIAKGDEASGVKKLPVEYRKKVLFFFWSAILMSNELSQSRHAAVATLISGLPGSSSLVIDTVQNQV